MKKKIKISDDNNQRIDLFLVNILDKSRNFIQEKIKSERITVNGIKVKTGYILKAGDEIELDIEDNIVAREEPVYVGLDIVYQDDDVAVVNKPKGLVVHPASSYQGTTLVNALLAEIDNLSGINGVVRPGIVHRIDKDTSGLLVIAKNDEAHNFLALELKKHAVKRHYYSLVYGEFLENEGIIDAPIGRLSNNRLKMGVVETGKEAITKFVVIKRFSGFTLLDVELETGRTHQIRVHMEYIKHPIVGDKLYGPKDVIGESGQFLHAYRLSFTHPKTKKEMTFTCDLPNDFKNILDELLKA